MSDTRPPYFPLYVLDFAGSGRVEAMTTEAVGAYILLLCKAWHQDPPCSLPDDDRTLARWSRLSDDDWSSVKLTVRACWERRADGRLYQPRLDREWRKLRELQRKKADAGRKGGLATKQRLSTATSTAAAQLPALPQHSESESESESDQNQSSSSYASASETAVAEELGDRIRLLMSIGLGTGDAAKWAKHANATPERVRFLVAKAASGVWKGDVIPRVCAGIRDAYDIPPPEADAVKAKAARILAGVGKVRKTKEHQ